MKIKISKKNILEEGNCGCGTAPEADVPQMSPQQAYDAGYNDAVAEIMDMISEMMAGGIPVDIAVPAGIAHMDQLEES